MKVEVTNSDGTPLTLTNTQQSGQELTVNTDGTFTLGKVEYMDPYSVVISNIDDSQECTVVNSDGIMGAGEVIVTVSCETSKF